MLLFYKLVASGFLGCWQANVDKQPQTIGGL